MPKRIKALDIDGASGEGGGQLVRVAVGLSAVTSRPVRITNIRGSRPRGGGLKSQHATAIAYLAGATSALAEGLEEGSKTLVFAPSKTPIDLLQRNFKINAESASASILLIFQAVLPFLIFAGTTDDGEEDDNDGSGSSVKDNFADEVDTHSNPDINMTSGSSCRDKLASQPITLEITGGTNVSFAPSFEYVDQVLLPTLEDRFGLRIERELLRRGWSLGPNTGRGAVTFRIWPLRGGQKLQPTDAYMTAFSGGERGLDQFHRKSHASGDGDGVQFIDVSIIAPESTRKVLRESVAEQVSKHFPRAETTFKITEDSGHDVRVYVLLVARTGKTAGGGQGIRWGRDMLTSVPKKGKAAASKDGFAAMVARKVCEGLRSEVVRLGRATGDGYLQDQLVIFQALAEGRTVFERGNTSEEVSEDLDRMRKDKFRDPFGQGSLHSQTARWVASELLSEVQWFNGGTVCEGVGLSLGK